MTIATKLSMMLVAYAAPTRRDWTGLIKQINACLRMNSACFHYAEECFCVSCMHFYCVYDLLPYYDHTCIICKIYICTYVLWVYIIHTICNNCK
jgi:hypothetical protein